MQMKLLHMVGVNGALHTHTHRSMSTLKSQVLSLIFMLKLQSLVAGISAQTATEKKKKREEENRMRGEDRRWIG